MGGKLEPVKPKQKEFQVWKHKTIKGTFVGSYDYNKKTGKRFLELIRSSGKGKRRYTVSTPAVAKKQGWRFRK